MNTQEKIQIAAIIVTVIGWTATGFIAYRCGLRSQRIAREFAAKDAAASRRREFLGFVCDLKTHIDECDDPTVWVDFFKNNAPRLKSEFSKISNELSGTDKARIQEAVDSVMKFARMDHQNVYANERELKESLEKLPDI